MRQTEHEFDTQAEAGAFMDGVEFVNDSAIEVVDHIIERDGKFIVTTVDNDADDDDEEDDEEDDWNVGDDLCDRCMRSGVEVYRTDEAGNTICVECEANEDE